MSASSATLRSMPFDDWNQRSAPTREAAAQRLEALKGCVIVCIVTGYSQKRSIYQRIKELGVRHAQYHRNSDLTSRG